MTTPASIRYNNPGAQYPGPSARKYGSTGTEIIGGGHKIAVFDDPVKGAAAQFDLLNRGYTGMTLQDAIRKWSGGNSSGAYAAQISKATGLPLDAPLTPEVLRNPSVAIPLARTAADWEAGGKYPMTEEQWQAAYAMANGGAMPRTNVAQNGAISGGQAPGMGGTSAAPVVATGGSPSGSDATIESIVSSVFGKGDAGADGKGGSLFGSLGGLKVSGANDDTLKAAQAQQQAAGAPGTQFQHTPFDAERLRQVIARRPVLGIRSA